MQELNFGNRVVVLQIDKEIEYSNAEWKAKYEKAVGVCGTVVDFRPNRGLIVVEMDSTGELLAFFKEQLKLIKE